MITRTSIIVWGIVGVILLLSVNLRAEQMQLLTCEEPPMNFMEDNKITGFTTDIVRELKRHTGTEEKIRLLPWKRVYRTGLEAPNVILFTAGRTEEREKLFHWIGPVVKKRWILFSKKGAGINLSSLDEARGAGKIGVMRNDSRHQFLTGNGFDNIFVTENHVHGLKMLLRGRVALWASAEFEASAIAKKAGLDPNKLETGFVIKTIYAYILISKKTPGATVMKWQDAFEKITKDGTIQKIAEKWAKKLNLPFTAKNGMIVFDE